MWVDYKISIGKETHSAKLNAGEDFHEVELPYFKGWKDVSSLIIDDAKCDVIMSVDLGDRNETIIMRCKNEYKSVKSRKKS